MRKYYMPDSKKGPIKRISRRILRRSTKIESAQMINEGLTMSDLQIRSEAIRESEERESVNRFLLEEYSPK